MATNNSLLTFLLAVSVIFCVCKQVNGLKVTVYYEALCPDSVRFIGQQLYPHWDKIADYVDELELVPYGKAIHAFHPAVVGTNMPAYYEFLCQHGPEECKGNKYQACALSQNKGKNVDVSLVYCVMKNRNRSSLAVVEECANRFNLDILKLRSCSNSLEGDQLLAKLGDKTLQLDIAFIPTIVFDDKFDQTSQDQSLKDFVAVVCSKIQNTTKPRICEGRKLPLVGEIYFF